MKVYLDNNATTKMDREAFEAMVPFFCEHYGNSSSMHSFGKETGKALDESRENISKILGIKPSELVFAGTGVEGNNIAIRGIAKSYKKRGKHIITSAIESMLNIIGSVSGPSVLTFLSESIDLLF